jgi:DNA-binding MarR family transcriptional regulator
LSRRQAAGALARESFGVYTQPVTLDFLEAARTIADECTCMRARQASRVLSRLYDEELRPTGVQISQLTVLVAAARFEAGARIAAMADALGMDRTTLTRNLRPLEQEGLLRVARDPADARARIVLLTRAGERVIERVFPAWQQSQKRLRALLGTDQAKELHDRFIRVSAAVLQGDAPRPPLAKRRSPNRR